MDFFHRSAFSQCLIHDEMAFAGRGNQHVEKLFFRVRIEILRMAQTKTSRLQAADRLLEGFLIGFADTHNLADGAHLGSQLVLHAFKLFKCPAGKFDNHIIAVRHVLIQGAVLSARNVL